MLLCSKYLKCDNEECVRDYKCSHDSSRALRISARSSRPPYKMYAMVMVITINSSGLIVSPVLEGEDVAAYSATKVITISS